MKKMIGKMLAFTILVISLFSMLKPMGSFASETDIAAKIEALKVKFPEGKYWNHVGSTTDNEDGWTESPCTCHGAAGVSHVDGTGGCTCNHHVDSGHLLATQCMGFANKLGYDVFGETTWTKYENVSTAQLANIKIGDIVRYFAQDTSGHSVFVIARSGDLITVGEANYSGKCRISWTRTLDLTKVTVVSYEHADNYDTIAGTGLTQPGTGEAAGSTPTQTGSVPVDYTGWMQTEDGAYYYYVKEGVVVKEKWLTINKKKYYLDKNGYRVTGLYNIGSETYYFDNGGVLQKEKWVKVDGEDYYVGKAGTVLKSQWLYLGNVLVYVTKDGSVAKNEMVKIGKNTYYFNSKGKRSKGFKKYNGKYYYCDKKGIIQKKKWITAGGKQYYLQKSGVRAQDKLVKIGKYQYYFNTKGQMVKKKKITYKGKVYKADKYGHCKFVQYAKQKE